MSEKQFWGATPRKLKALVDVHIYLNDPDAKKGASRETKKAYIDQVLF